MDNALCPKCGKAKKPWFPFCWDCSEKENSNQPLLNSTAIGKEFTISNQRVNLILSELGWLEKDVAGWKVTKQGKGMGGRQFESDTGQAYVKWPEAILKNKTLLDVFNLTTDSKHVKEPVIASDLPSQNDKSQFERLNDKYPATLKTLDGHFVRSRAEALIDNFLYISGIAHAYERKLQTEESFYCDFYIPSGSGRPQPVWIEFWGWEDDEKYTARKNKKIKVYQENEW